MRMPQVEPILKCRKCGKAIVKFGNEAEQLFEGMHWLCFHFEYEHEGEPDAACGDFSCPNLKIETYEAILREAGIDPQREVANEVKRRLNPPA
jgi:hypothetical protein